MNTKYAELINKLELSNLSYESDEEFNTVAVEYERNAFALMQIENDKYISGVGYYCEDDNSFDYSNVRCPEFDNADDAFEWLVNW